MQYNFKDLTGCTYGRLTVIDRDLNGSKNGTYWNCLCQCGKTKSVRSSHLTSGKISSCSCYMVECTIKRNTHHGETKNNKRSGEYTAWRAMKQRIHSESYHAKNRYSERGITICERWENSFEAFLEDMGKKPTSKHTLDRVENNRGYYKENCAWRTVPQQQKNKSNNRWIEYNGVKKILSDWARYFKVKPSTVSEHLITKSFEQLYNFYKNK